MKTLSIYRIVQEKYKIAVQRVRLQEMENNPLEKKIKIEKGACLCMQQKLMKLGIWVKQVTAVGCVGWGFEEEDFIYLFIFLSLLSLSLSLFFPFLFHGFLFNYFNYFY